MAAKIPTPRYSKPSGKEECKHLPAPYKMRRYYTPAEVEVHNTADNLWVSFFNRVYDLSELVQDNRESEECEPLISAAGSDITHWFDPKTRDPVTYIDPHTNTRVYFCPQGRFIHVPPIGPDSNWDNEFRIPWWKNEKYCIGSLTRKTRKIRIINTLTKHDDILEVCSEETLNEILDRYIPINQHADSYTWKRLGRPLDMEKTLDQNDIPDETEEYIDLGIDEDEYIPAIHLYFNDDLTVA